MSETMSMKLVEGGKHIAILWAYRGSYVDHEIEQGISRGLLECDHHEYRLRLDAQKPEATDLKRSFLDEVLKEPSIIALLAVFIDFDQSLVEALAKKGKPTVFIERPLPIRGDGTILLDHVMGARLAAKAMLDLGRKRIGFIGPCLDVGWAGSTRLNEIRSVLAERGLMLEAEDEGCYDMKNAAAATEKLLDRVPDLDTIIFASDIQAFGGIRTLRARGISVPDRMAIMGFDNSDSARRAAPALASVHQPFDQMGALAVHMLLKTIAGEKDALKNITLPEELVLRGSCLPRGQTERVFRAA